MREFLQSFVRQVIFPGIVFSLIPTCYFLSLFHTLFFRPIAQLQQQLPEYFTSSEKLIINKGEMTFTGDTPVIILSHHPRKSPIFFFVLDPEAGAQKLQELDTRLLLSEKTLYVRTQAKTPIIIPLDKRLHVQIDKNDIIKFSSISSPVFYAFATLTIFSVSLTATLFILLFFMILFSMFKQSNKRLIYITLLLIYITMFIANESFLSTFEIKESKFTYRNDEPQLKEKFPFIRLILHQPEEKNLFILADPSSIKEPQYYYHAIKLCQTLYEKDAVEYTLTFHGSLVAHCDDIRIWTELSGSTSHVIWRMNSLDRYEEMLRSSLIVEHYNRAPVKEEIQKKIDKLLNYHETPSNYWDAGHAMYQLSISPKVGTGYSQALKDAEQYFKKGTEVDPQFAPNYASLAYILALQQPLGTPLSDEVEQLFAKAKELDPGWSFSWMNRALLLNKPGTEEEAYAEAKQAIIQNPKFPGLERVKYVYICIARQLKKKEPQNFYQKYSIDMKKDVWFCGY